jgi:hypothetical protein
MQPLADDLLAYRAQCSRTGDGDLIFPGQEGAPWSESAWRNWRRRSFAKAAVAVGLHGARPYDLRHSFVSLLIAEGRGVIDVARQAGHSPTMALDVYGHVFDDWDPADRISAEARVATARECVQQGLVGGNVDREAASIEGRPKPAGVEHPHGTNKPTTRRDQATTSIRATSANSISRKVHPGSSIEGHRGH